MKKEEERFEVSGLRDRNDKKDGDGVGVPQSAVREVSGAEEGGE